ncbi:MAG: proteasome subunit beta [Candidatus Heimdallarchaeota archaeon]|nr:proteasome subunit beta [Candidatus Heimdallarchaeota archaeon]MCK4955335.1 proteasome subunit beta [Candidatus Heimdallarchaeota archaeon]
MNNPNFNRMTNDPTMELKHGTTTVALQFKGGVAAAADRRASMGTFVASKKAEKLHELNKFTMATIAGMVSDAQYLVNLTRANINLYELGRGYAPTTKMAGNLLASIMYEQYRSYFPYWVNMLVIGLDDEGPHVYTLDMAGGIGDEDFASTGSGSPVAYGVLESQWKQNLTEEEGIAIAIKALTTAISRDSATGDGMDVAIVNKKGIKRLTPEEVKAVQEA